MPYAVRDALGRITSLHRHDPGVGEPLAADHADVRRFLGSDAAAAPSAGAAAGGRLGARGAAAAAAAVDGVAAIDGRGFTGADDGGDPGDGFEQLDADFIRVLEDVIDALTSRHLINVTDLPEIAQTKLFARRSFRERRPVGALELFRPGDLEPML